MKSFMFPNSSFSWFLTQIHPPALLLLTAFKQFQGRNVVLRIVFLYVIQKRYSQRNHLVILYSLCSITLFFKLTIKCDQKKG